MNRKDVTDALEEKGYMVGVIIRTNGKVEGWLGKDFNDMQEAVGGLIELVYRGDNFDVWANEEGRIEPVLPVNAGLAVLISENDGLPLRTLLDNPIHVDVLLLGIDDECESTSCPENVMEMAKDLSIWKEPSTMFITMDDDGNLEVDKI